MSELQLGQMRIPDILETIADLSNDEVFTPPQLANKVLDTLPEEIWSNSKITFLDPACKTGVFLREIAKRLIVGLEEEIPDLQERVNHILTKQVFGLGITELTTLMSRRTVYCATKANSEASVCTAFNNAEGNIKFPNSKHIFNEKNKKCTICGAGEDLYHEIENRDNYAYSFLHDNLKEVFGDVKFDVIIGNPPYQLETGGAGAQATPLYHKFIEKAIELSPRYISMITPSRWMVGGMGLNEFREKMLKTNNFKSIFDYENSLEVFPNVGVNGGISYFLWDKEYHGKTNYTFRQKNGEEIKSFRLLKEDFSDYVIRNNKYLPIIKKTNPILNKETSFETLVSSRNPFGLKTNFFNVNQKLKTEKEENLIKVYGLLGKDRTVRYIDKKEVDLNQSSFDKYKIFFPSAMGTETTILPKVIIGLPNEACTGTFMVVGEFNKEDEMQNCISYMKTKFFRALFEFNKYAFFFTKRTFSLIPLQDFSKAWTDAELYKKYNLTEEEIAYIEENIEEMK